MTPLGLYIHLPFCAGRCPYCDFFARPYAPGPARALVPALIRHLELIAPRAAGRVFSHVYLGGGTPSLWPAAAIAELIAAAAALVGLSPDCEVSMEANPGGLGGAKLARLRAAGVNRLSLGAQSFSPDLLAAIGRRHGPGSTARAVDQARTAGFMNLSLDLIYGLPGQTPEMARRDILAALALAPDHLSLYELTLAPETPFGRRYQKNRPPLPGEDAILAMEDQALELAAAAGLMRYEVSNFARPGFECRHNADTWAGGDYLALGPGAHGHLAGVRWALVADVEAYLEGIAAGAEPLAWREELSGAQRALELVMLGLRATAGVDLAACAALMGRPVERAWAAPLAEVQARGWAGLAGGRLVPTALGLRMADAAAALFA
ncbi:MAG: radical SAM family heme chaperone HemW [Thermodesulfobacteriota bacterium]